MTKGTLVRALRTYCQSDEEAMGMYYSLKDEVTRAVQNSSLEDDDTLDELECIFANYELELDWSWIEILLKD